MKRVFLFLIVAALLGFNVEAQQKLTADAGNTKLKLLGEKVTGKHEGGINLQSGWISWKDNKIQSGEFVI
ncbi:MAG: YceI family protein, partial [Bacteroidia bacterium]|nr:YceI family protein [Bacteroidia bacterium]